MVPASEPRAEVGYAAERFKAFADAVVAIALTLLILPLMDSVSEVASAGDGAFAWLTQHGGQLLNFVLSFVLIAMFWMIHHRLFSAVDRVTPTLMWLLAAWLLTIVWLPVATAVAGRMDDGDRVAKALYIGSLILTAAMSLVVRLYLRAHPVLHRMERGELRSGLAVDLSLVLLFGAALAAALLIPGVGYYALFVMVLTGVVQRIIEKILATDP
ncbi:hypothetical protein H490_0108300 [Leucobacter sp. UCD-THU]|uniref:TMEM175 family protein n=1 Tax=Leucobacter sp. UCD-THU TaxID=1292023 RepID=UPI0003636245|nr:TMEM175 family protein [Leucobacter sp. UCD-THU]EYT54867.1 hypothetical protein H490_0108300 [Leucobacter sp. UCD-THU]